MGLATQAHSPQEVFRLKKLLFYSAIQAALIILDFVSTLHPTWLRKAAVEPIPFFETNRAP
ncbi:MAG TPA: hypothetical protein DDZ51_27620 [Planctomycetaceae bacterium]|nr:hypothetical protein [Planctomycetaceae bacterium]